MVCLWPVLGPKTTPGRAGIARKISSGGVLGRLGVAALRFCASWLRLGPLLGRFLGHLGPILAPKMAPESDFGPTLAPKMALKSDLIAPRSPPGQDERMYVDFD